MMTSRSCGGVARAGPRRATSDPLSCRSTRHSTSSPPRASSGSVLNLQSVTKRANSSLEAAKDFGAQLFVIDTVADAFGGNYNDPGQVRQFVQQAPGKIARE